MGHFCPSWFSVRSAVTFCLAGPVPIPDFLFVAKSLACSKPAMKGFVSKLPSTIFTGKKGPVAFKTLF